MIKFFRRYFNVFAFFPFAYKIVFLSFSTAAFLFFTFLFFTHLRLFLAGGFLLLWLLCFKTELRFHLFRFGIAFSRYFIDLRIDTFWLVSFDLWQFFIRIWRILHSLPLRLNFWDGLFFLGRRVVKMGLNFFLVRSLGLLDRVWSFVIFFLSVVVVIIFMAFWGVELFFCVANQI